MNLIFIRDQNVPPPTPYEQYVDLGNNINFIFIRDQNSPPPINNSVDWDNSINFIDLHTHLNSDAAQRQGGSEHV